MKEIWKDIVGYEGLYQVSNLGNVKSLNFNQTGREHLLKPSILSIGYFKVSLRRNGETKHFYIHRLVASAFLENPDNLPQVNHKDECKTNNCVENLEWCTAKYNINYGTCVQRIVEAHKGVSNIKLAIPVDMLSMQGELVGQFPSIAEAERWLRSNGFPRASHQNINMCCKNKRNFAYGFKWRYGNQ